MTMIMAMAMATTPPTFHHPLQKWPFSHFKEKVKTADPDVAARCLSPVPIVYTHASNYAGVAEWSKQKLRRPFILVSGQSDFGASKGKALLGDSNLLRWYSQNADITHPKLYPLPIGLNCFEHAPEMHQTLGQLGNVQRNKVLMVNFGNTHPSRKQVWEQFCGKNANKPFATCKVKSQSNNIQGNPHLVSYYKKVAEHKFVLSPRGNGLDTHRLWEALYLGCIPVVGSSILDGLYSGFPILVVKDWSKIDERYLHNEYQRMKPLLRQSVPAMHREYWWRTIESARSGFMRSLGMPNATRYKCWG
mmetsp:Transcript_70169/g.196394  ORF Transcript_70169/g.196394 Transcript_70169/m.196394 type:complete len:304 (+) Transcript_70169:294-1205(+)